MRRSAAILVGLLCGAGGYEHDNLDPRSLGRAGTPMVSAEGGAALQRNPAGLARQPELRFEIGNLLSDHDSTFDTGDLLLLQPCNPTLPPQTQPVVANRGPPARKPSLALSSSFGPLVIGASFRVAEHRSTRLPRPEFGTCAADVIRLFPHRYRGLEEEYQRQALTLGAALRTDRGLAAGIALEGSKVKLTEQRRIWGGETPSIDPSQDLDLRLSGDNYVPAIHAGVIYGPEDWPFEFALAGSFVFSSTLSGDAVLAVTHIGVGPFPDSSMPGQARLAVPAQTALRLGVRYLGERLSLESAFEWQNYSGAPARRWQCENLPVRGASGVLAELRGVSSRTSFEDGVATRTAFDFDLIPGLLALTSGYALITGPTLHTAALGIEARFEQVLFGLGYARTFSRRLAERAPIESLFAQDTPPISGRSQSSGHTIGLVVELAVPR